MKVSEEHMPILRQKSKPMPAKTTVTLGASTEPDAVTFIVDHINWGEFLRTKINSFIKWDLVRFYHDNPHTRDTAENIAKSIGREMQTIERELQNLAAAKILRVQQIRGVNVYLYGDDLELRDLIHRFMEACQDRDFRAKAIQHVVRAMQAAGYETTSFNG
jgi:DNA-binding transcriptional regulator YhcF (GntR family)